MKIRRVCSLMAMHYSPTLSPIFSMHDFMVAITYIARRYHIVSYVAMSRRIRSQILMYLNCTVIKIVASQLYSQHCILLLITPQGYVIILFLLQLIHCTAALLVGYNLVSLSYCVFVLCVLQHGKKSMMCIDVAFLCFSSSPWFPPFYKINLPIAIVKVYTNFDYSY